MAALLWIQDSAAGVWLRESSWALFTALIAHTIGMGFTVGVAITADLRLLGVARSLAVGTLGQVLPVMKWAALLAILSGIALVTAYPAKALTNPVFYIKVALLGAAAWLSVRLLRAAAGLQLPHRLRLAASTNLLLWIAALCAGKLLPYTHRVLLVYP